MHYHKENVKIPGNFGTSEHFNQNVLNFGRNTKICVKISSIISSSFGRIVKTNLEYYKRKFW